MEPLVSVCMPTWNREEFLAEAVNSIIAQTYKNWELIVVDDGSTDSTAVLMQYYTELDSRIKYFKKENGGIAKARNYALKQAKGSYVAVQDSDDISNQNRLKEAIKLLTKTGTDYFYSAYARADEHGRVQDGIAPTDKITAAEIRFNQAVPHATIVAKASCFKDHPYRDYLTSNDDLALVVDWYKTGYTYCMSKEPLYMVRFHPTNTSKTKDKEVKKFTKQILKELDGVE